MLIYWSMFALPALSAVFTDRRTASGPSQSRLGLALTLIVFVVLIGLRFEVGGDWYNYERIMDYIRHEKLTVAVAYGDPGFSLVSWISMHSGLGATGPSILCGGILVYGLWRFASGLDSPWLAVTAAVPYLLIVVGMGYVRQSAAIGFIFLALVQFEQRSTFHFLKWMLLAALFHASSLCVLPVAALVVARKQPFATVPIVVIGVLLYVYLLQDKVDVLYSGYVEAEYDSSGAFIRLAMNAVPAVLFLALRDRFPVTDTGRALWSLIAYLALALIVLVIVSPSSTAIDRIGLYLIPIQIFVFGNIVGILGRTMKGRRMLTFAAVGYYGLVLFTWLNYATHAEFWIPYKFLPFS